MTYYDLNGHALEQEPLSGHEITILVDLSIVIATVFSLPDLCLEVGKKISKKIMHFHYMTYGHALGQEPLPQRS